MNGYRIVRHPGFADDILGIARFVAGYAGWQAACKKLDEIERSIRRLSDFPHVGSTRDEILPGLRAIPIAGNGVLCFVVDDDAREVQVITVSYAGSDWTATVGQRRNLHYGLG